MIYQLSIFSEPCFDSRILEGAGVRVMIQEVGLATLGLHDLPPKR
jgi:hypothetical protein